MKRALVISGGGSKGSFSAGAIQQLVVQRQFWFDYISGVSIGALNTLMMAQAQDLGHSMQLSDKLRLVWLNIEGKRDIYKPWYSLPFIPDNWNEGLNALLTLVFGKDSLYSLAPARKLVAANVDPEHLKRSPIVGRAGFVDLKSKEYMEWSSFFGPSFIEAVWASGAIPMTFLPVPLPGDILGVDGGVREGTPLRSTLDTMARRWPDEEHHVYTLIHSSKVEKLKTAAVAGIKLRGWLKVGERALGAMQDEVHTNDIKTVLELQKYGAYPNVTLWLIYPNESLGDGLGFEPGQMYRNWMHGYARAKELGDEPFCGGDV